MVAAGTSETGFARIKFDIAIPRGMKLGAGEVSVIVNEIGIVAWILPTSSIIHLFHSSILESEFAGKRCRPLR